MNATTATRFCRDCKHLEPSDKGDAAFNLALAKCGRTALAPDPVTGESKRHFCETERTSGLANRCGIAGQFFEPDDADIIP